MTRREVMVVVNRYIGVNSGYLGDFTYRSHSDFYFEYCDLDYNPQAIQGTTRERFMAILLSAPPAHQARILRGVIQRFPIGGELAPPTRTKELAEEILAIATRLEATGPVPTPSLGSGVPAVEATLADAETLLSSSGPVSAVDRVHTALHGYLEELAREAGAPVTSDPSMTELFGLLRRHHPRLSGSGPHAEALTKVLRGVGQIMDALQPVRNRGSLAHPNQNLIEGAEAMLVVNLVRSVLSFLRDKVGGGPANTGEDVWF